MRYHSSTLARYFYRYDRDFIERWWFRFTQSNHEDIRIIFPIPQLLAMGSVSPSSTPIAPPSPPVRQAIAKPIADRNVHHVVLGDLLFKSWYPSFYPEELVGRDLERLYVCQRCFKYSKELMPFLAHVVKLAHEKNLILLKSLTLLTRNHVHPRICR